MSICVRTAFQKSIFFYFIFCVYIFFSWYTINRNWCELYLRRDEEGGGEVNITYIVYNLYTRTNTHRSYTMCAFGPPIVKKKRVDQFVFTLLDSFYRVFSIRIRSHRMWQSFIFLLHARLLKFGQARNLICHSKRCARNGESEHLHS